jgi:hypothetical protein
MPGTPASFEAKSTRKRLAFLATLSLLCAVAVVALASSIADASCTGDVSVQDSVRSAPTVFVGTVLDVSNGGRVAAVRVDDVWRGRGIPASVDVVGSPDLNAAATSVDRTYAAGSQYLFVPDGGGPEHFTDNSCTAAQLYSGTLGARRPAGAPGVPVRVAAAFPLVAVVVATGLVMLGGVGLAVILRGRRLVNPSA